MKIKQVIKLLMTFTIIIYCLHVFADQIKSKSTFIGSKLEYKDSEGSDGNVKTQPNYSLNFTLFPNYSFNFTLLPKDACENDLYIIVCVISQINSFNVRKQWRKSMINISLTNLPSQTDTHGYRMVFLVAEGSLEDLKTKESLQREHMDHGDILQLGVQEHYQNLVFKSLAMLDWFDKTCNGTQFLLKIDDDVFLNLPKVLDIIQMTQRQNMNSSKNFLIGHNAPVLVHRSKTDKWYVPETVYNKTRFPAYVSGAAYVMTKMAVHQIRSQCAEITPIHIEDVFVTGICRERAGIIPLHNNKFCMHYYKVKVIPKQCATLHTRRK